MRPVTPKNVYSRQKALDTRVTNLERRIPPSSGIYEIKVFADANALDGNLPDSATVVSTGDGKFIWAVPVDLDTYYLTMAEAFITTLSSGGDVEVMIRNITQSQDMLNGPITIAAGNFTSFPLGLTTDIDFANAQVDFADLLSVDVDSAGTGAQGLGVILRFSPTDPLPP